MATTVTSDAVVAVDADEEHPSQTGAIRAHDPSKPLANFSPGPAPLPPARLKESVP